MEYPYYKDVILQPNQAPQSTSSLPVVEPHWGEVETVRPDTTAPTVGQKPARKNKTWIVFLVIGLMLVAVLIGLLLSRASGATLPTNKVVSSQTPHG